MGGSFSYGPGSLRYGPGGLRHACGSLRHANRGAPRAGGEAPSAVGRRRASSERPRALSEDTKGRREGAEGRRRGSGGRPKPREACQTAIWDVFGGALSRAAGPRSVQLGPRLFRRPRRCSAPPRLVQRRPLAHGQPYPHAVDSGQDHPGPAVFGCERDTICRNRRKPAENLGIQNDSTGLLARLRSKGHPRRKP